MLPQLNAYWEIRGGLLFTPKSVEECYQPVVLEADAPERNVIPPGFCIMFAGNIGAAQDFDTILRAAEELRDVHDIHWVIIGDGRKRAWVNEQVKRRQLSKTVHTYWEISGHVNAPFFFHLPMLCW